MSRKKKQEEESGGTLKWGLIICAALVLWTCPDKEDHLKEIRKAVQAKMNSDQETAMSAMMVAALGGGNGYESLVMNALAPEYKNYWIFSLTTRMVNGKSELLSIGACGEVATFWGD